MFYLSYGLCFLDREDVRVIRGGVYGIIFGGIVVYYYISDFLESLNFKQAVEYVA